MHESTSPSSAPLASVVPCGARSWHWQLPMAAALSVTLLALWPGARLEPAAASAASSSSPTLLENDELFSASSLLGESTTADHAHPDEALLRGLLVSAWDVEWVRPRLARLGATRGRLVGIAGPGAIFAASSAQTALERHAELTGAAHQAGTRTIATSSALRTPTDPVTRALALAFAGQPLAAHSRAGFARRNAAPGAVRAGLALVEAITGCRTDHPTPQIRLCLVEAVEQAPAGDTWAAYALARFDAAQGHPGEATVPLARRLARYPQEESTAFGLAWAQWRAGDRTSMDRTLAHLEAGGYGPEVPLVRAATAFSDGKPALAASAVRTLRRFGVPLTAHLPQAFSEEQAGESALRASTNGEL